VPPSAARSLSTAASVTSSLVCDESISEMSVANRLFCPRQKRKKETMTGDTEHREVIAGQLKSWGLELMIRVAHPRIHLLPLGRVATHGVHWRGEPRAYLLDGVVVFPPVRRCG